MALQSRFLLGAYSSNGGISSYISRRKKAANKNSPAHTHRNKLRLQLDISIQKNKK